LNNGQIKLVQTAIRKAGLRDSEGRYRMLLGQYKQPNGSAVTSCKQLTSYQLEDILAICEAYGWQMPGKEADHFRSKAAKRSWSGAASFAQQSAIKNLAGDLGWSDSQLAGMIKRVTKNDKKTVDNVAALTSRQGHNVIEAVKAILSRQTNKQYSTLDEVKKDFKEATDGKKTR